MSFQVEILNETVFFRHGLSTLLTNFSALETNNFFRVRVHNDSQKRFGRHRLRHFLPSRESRAERMTFEKSYFFAPEIGALTDFPVSETSLPFANYVARARPRDFVARKIRSTCGKSISFCEADFLSNS